jgi:hypothetical protein
MPGWLQEGPLCEGITTILQLFEGVSVFVDIVDDSFSERRTDRFVSSLFVRRTDGISIERRRLKIHSELFFIKQNNIHRRHVLGSTLWLSQKNPPTPCWFN